MVCLECSQLFAVVAKPLVGTGGFACLGGEHSKPVRDTCRRMMGISPQHPSE